MMNGRAAWFLRVRMPDGSRPRIPLGVGLSPARAESKAAAWMERRDELVAGYMAEQAAVAQRKASTGQAAPMTVRQLGGQWTSGELLATHGRTYGLKVKKSVEDDGYRLGRCYAARTRGDAGPTFGDLPASDVTEADIARVLAQAPAGDARAATVEKYHAVLHRLFDLAERPARVRERNTNPVDRGLRLAKDDSKVFSYLYPAEALDLFGCRTVALGRRVLYALAAYTGLREGSLLALRWRDLDIPNRTLTTLVQKNGTPQMFAVTPDLADVLHRWWARCGRPNGDAPIVAHLDIAVRHLATTLRADLRAAGVTRAALFVENDDRIEPLRFHDLRATFVTWAKRAGKGEGWITDRTGHLDPKMVARYTRAARALADLDFAAFPDLSEALPDLPHWPTIGPKPADEGRGGEGNGTGFLSVSAVVHEGGLEPPCLSAPEPKGDPNDPRRPFSAGNGRVEACGSVPLATSKCAFGPFIGPKRLPSALAAFAESMADEPELARSLLVQWRLLAASREP